MPLRYMRNRFDRVASASDTIAEGAQRVTKRQKIRDPTSQSWYACNDMS
jgi:hypothetical protein